MLLECLNGLVLHAVLAEDLVGLVLVEGDTGLGELLVLSHEDFERLDFLVVHEDLLVESSHEELNRLEGKIVDVVSILLEHQKDLV